jgi:hypothetical protein
MTRFFVLCLSLALFSCSSLPPKTEAIHNALVLDSALRQAAEQCGNISQEDRRLAERERALWWSRNGNWVVAADYGMLQLNWDLAAKEFDGQRAVLGMQLLEQIQLDSDDMSAKWVGDSETSQKCEKLFKSVAKGKLDLDQSKKHLKSLNELSDSRSDVSKVAEIARSINSRYRKYGRSLFVVEKTLKETGCSNPQISLLRNSWPIEVYDAACSQKDYLLVKCEWGRCEVKR